MQEIRFFPHNFQSFADISAELLHKWSVGQDLPAIEGHGGLRPGKWVKEALFLKTYTNFFDQ